MDPRRGELVEEGNNEGPGEGIRPISIEFSEAEHECRVLPCPASSAYLVPIPSSEILLSLTRLSEALAKLAFPRGCNPFPTAVALLCLPLPGHCYHSGPQG